MMGRHPASMAQPIPPPADTPARDLRELAWRCLVAIGAGAIVGMVVGGLGGRVVMLVIRHGSNPVVRGVLTDDGFRIGEITAATLVLVLVAAVLGGVTGALYLLLRSALPRRGRMLLWGAAVGLYAAADVLKPDEFDFTALDPKPFIVASFVLLPVVGATAIAITVERLLGTEPWSSRGLTTILLLGVLPLVPALPLFAAAAAVVLAGRRMPGVRRRLRTPSHVLVPAALAALAGVSVVRVWVDAAEILS
jgi:hypothetical protein